MTTIDIVSWNFFSLVVLSAAIHHLLPRKLRGAWLLAVSYYFYSTWNWQYPIILLVISTINFFLGRFIEKTKSGGLFSLGIGINAGSLVLMKWLAGPYGGNILGQLSTTGISKFLLPIGFSFYILQAISYLIDIFRGHQKAEENFIHFALFLGYFPKLLAGPIERAKNFLPQLKQKRDVDRDLLGQGLYLILIGLLRKIVIADHLYQLQPGNIFSLPENYSSVERVLFLLIFAITIYNDFAGYSSMVRGVSCFFGIELSVNFRQPFLAKSFGDFWARWHISLSEWLRDYIFYPTRRWLMTHRSNYWLATIVPPLITMLASGYWHGAYLAILLWGLLHGSYLVIEQLLQQAGRLANSRQYSQLYRILVFVAVTITWIPFNTPSIRSAGRYLASFTPPYSTSFNGLILPDIFLLFLFSFWMDLQEQYHNDPSFPRRWGPRAQAWATAVAILLIMLFISNGTDLSGFVYQGY